MKKTNRSRLSLLPIIYIGIAIILAGCNTVQKSRNTETPTRGKIRILVDDSFKPIVESEISAFTSVYQNASITPLYKPEVDIVNDFMKDSGRLMVTSRKLTDDQIKYLRDSLIVARTVSFAWDALALVVNRSNPDSLLKYDEVKGIFRGDIKDWSEVNKHSGLGQIRVIFDNTKSGNIRYFREKFDMNEALPANIFAVNSNLDVINFVEKNKDAIGVISVNWISDKDDSLMMSFSRKVKVCAISQQYADDGSYYLPQPGFIYNKSYPFIREVYLISRETFTGLGSGFIQWATYEQGQRIVLKGGLVPATMPIRLVQIKQQ
ncbi:MAG: substrate-binding domain-containing protein [Bacteroidales bacterium]